MPRGMVSTYDLTVGVKIDIEDLIHLLDPTDTPLTGLNGAGVDGRQAVPMATCFEKKVEWLDEELLAPRSNVVGAQTNIDTAIEITTGDGLKFGVGDVLRIGPELVRVTAIATDTLTVTRGFAGTTGTAMADGAVIVGVGTALAEGSNPEAARSVDRTNRYNVTQIFGPHAIEVTETENVVAKWGLGGTTEFDHQLRNRTWECGISIEQALLYGSRYEDGTGKLRTMGGFDYYITTNVDAASTTLTDTLLLDQLQKVYDAGGRVTDVTVGSKQKRVISTFDSGDIRLDRGDNGRGQMVDFFDSDFGTVSIHLNRWVRVSDLFGWSRDQVSLETLRPLQFQMLAKTGDSMKGQIVTEKTARFRREAHAFKFTALT